MKKTDYLIVALAPLAVLLLPLVGNYTVEGCNWSPGDFLAGWVILASTIFLFRFLLTRAPTDFAYKAGAALAVTGGFLLTWVNLAVQVIGDRNPANLLYFAVLLAGLIGVLVSRFAAAGLARTAFGCAAGTFVVPLVAVLLWPGDFSPGVPHVFVLNLCFVLLFAGAGLLFRQSARRLAA